MAYVQVKSWNVFQAPAQNTNCDEYHKDDVDERSRYSRMRSQNAYQQAQDGKV